MIKAIMSTAHDDDEQQVSKLKITHTQTIVATYWNEKKKKTYFFTMFFELNIFVFS